MQRGKEDEERPTYAGKNREKKRKAEKQKRISTKKGEKTKIEFLTYHYFKVMNINNSCKQTNHYFNTISSKIRSLLITTI
jgi:hypothetical protein